MVVRNINYENFIKFDHFYYPYNFNPTDDSYGDTPLGDYNGYIKVIFQNFVNITSCKVKSQVASYLIDILPIFLKQKPIG